MAANLFRARPAVALTGLFVGFHAVLITAVVLLTRSPEPLSQPTAPPAPPPSPAPVARTAPADPAPPAFPDADREMPPYLLGPAPVATSVPRPAAPQQPPTADEEDLAQSPAVRPAGPQP